MKTKLLKIAIHSYDMFRFYSFNRDYDFFLMTKNFLT